MNITFLFKNRYFPRKFTENTIPSGNPNIRRSSVETHTCRYCGIYVYFIIYLPIYLSVYLSTYLSIYLSCIFCAEAVGMDKKYNGPLQWFMVKRLWLKLFYINLNDTYAEKLCFTQLSTRMAPCLLLTFFIWLHNQLSSMHSIITY